MTITRASNKTPGLHHYYVHSDSGHDYVVTHIRRSGMRRWGCSCPNFLFVRQARHSGRYCKHICAVREFANRKIEVAA